MKGNHLKPGQASRAKKNYRHNKKSRKNKPFWETDLNPITMLPPVRWFPRQDAPALYELEAQLNTIFKGSE